MPLFISRDDHGSHEIKTKCSTPRLGLLFGVSQSTVSRTFALWLFIMDVRLSPLIRWSETEELWRTMPQCFKFSFGTKTTVIIDCFEMFCVKPTNLLARAQTFSSYKYHNTVKVLIGITPQGCISFVSEAWVGRTSDKHLTENCGLLDKLLPGDLVIADRGFTIHDGVALKHAQLAIPAFTKGKEQQDPIDVETTRGIAHVRIHVEQVIGLLRRKYTILENTLTVDLLACNPHGNPEVQVPIIDRIIRVCSGLVNLCGPIVHSISFVSVKYTGVGGGGTKVCFCGYVPPGCLKKHPVLERINIQNVLTSLSGCW